MPPTRGGGAGGNGGPLKVLVLEDDVLIAWDLADMVAAAGCEVVGRARSCQEAVALAEAAAPDLMLTDVDLGDPGCDGINAAERITAAGGPRVAFLTAFAQDREIRDRMARVEPLAVLAKPIRAEQLGKVLAQARS